MGDLVQPRVQDPSPRAGAGGEHSQNHAWNGMEKGNSQPGEGKWRKTARKSWQAGRELGGAAGRAAGRDEPVENKRGEMEGEGRKDGNCKQTDRASRGWGGKRKKIIIT